jgi:hypothetical protein
MYMKYADGTRMVAQGDVLLVPYHGTIPKDAIDARLNGSQWEDTR